MYYCRLSHLPKKLKKIDKIVVVRRYSTTLNETIKKKNQKSEKIVEKRRNSIFFRRCDSPQ